MNAFTKKELAPPKRICLRLKEARENAGMTLEEVSRKTRISTGYIAALEECRFDDLPFSRTYQKHLIRSYVRAIGMDPMPYLAQYTGEELWHEKMTVAHPSRPKSLLRFVSLPLLFRGGMVAAIALLCIGYLGFQVKRIIEPPELAVFSPAQGDILRKSNLTVVGKTDPEVRVTINGAAVAQNNSGEFQATLDLPTGVNTLIISAKKKHGKTTTLIRNIIVREQSQYSFTSADETDERL